MQATLFSPHYTGGGAGCAAAQAQEGGLSAPFPHIEGDVKLAIIMGGTSTRCVLLNKSFDPDNPPVCRLGWEEYTASQGNPGQTGGRSAEEAAQDFVTHLARKAVQHFRSMGVKPSQIKKIGLSLPGQIESVQGTELLSTCNTKVEFHRFPFKERFISAFNAALTAGEPVSSGGATQPHHFSPQEVLALNDAQAGILGEAFHPRGKLVGVQNAVLVILGTGIGGAALKQGELDPDAWEFGHSFLFDAKQNRFKWFAKQDLTKMGLWRDGKFYQCSFPYSYMEERLAGPWVAARYVKALAQDRGYLHALLCDETYPVTEAAVRQLDEMPFTDSVHWGSELRDSAIKPILNRIVATTLADNLRAEVYPYPRDDEQDAALTRKTWEFKCLILKELGLGIDAVRRAFPRRRIVLVGGFIQALAGMKEIGPMDDAQILEARRIEFYRAVSNIARGSSSAVDLHVSELEGEVREAWGILGRPNGMGLNPGAVKG